MSYIFKSASGLFNQIGLEQSQNIFVNLTSDPEKLLAWHTLFMFFTCYICSKGVKGGLEKAVKFLIPVLFIILIGLGFYSFTLPGFIDGINYMFVPDISKITPQVILSAMGMACFS